MPETGYIDSLSAAATQKYLRLLGAGIRPPSYDALAELVMAQVTRAPFENISKLYYKKHIALGDLIDLERHLEGIERFNLGGTCYANNYYFHLLLKQLGYRVMLCGADMTDPDVHLVNLVHIEGREYLVDGGYGAPFLKPIPCDLNEDHVIELGNERYVLNPRDEKRRSRMNHYRDSQLIHGYTVKPIHREIGYFRAVIRDSFSDTASFMNGLVYIRFYSDRSIAIRNFNIIKMKGTDVEIQQMTGREELMTMAEELFSIPRDILTDAADEIAKLNKTWI